MHAPSPWHFALKPSTGLLPHLQGHRSRVAFRAESQRGRQSFIAALQNIRNSNPKLPESNTPNSTTVLSGVASRQTAQPRSNLPTRTKYGSANMHVELQHVRHNATATCMQHMRSVNVCTLSHSTVQQAFTPTYLLPYWPAQRTHMHFPA